MPQFTFSSPAPCFQIHQDLCSSPRANTCCLFFEKVAAGGGGGGHLTKAFPARMLWNVQGCELLTFAFHTPVLRAQGQLNNSRPKKHVAKPLPSPLLSVLHWGPAVTHVLNGNKYLERGWIFQPCCPNVGVLRRALVGSSTAHSKHSGSALTAP